MSNAKKYLISSAAAVLAAGIYVLLRMTVYPDEYAVLLNALCDGFAIVGIVYLGIGGLIFTSNEGSFDVFGYWAGVVRGKRKNDEHYKNLFEYRKQKQEQPKKDFLFLIVVGAVSLVLSLIFLMVTKL